MIAIFSVFYGLMYADYRLTVLKTVVERNVVMICLGFIKLFENLVHDLKPIAAFCKLNTVKKFWHELKRMQRPTNQRRRGTLPALPHPIAGRSADADGTAEIGRRCVKQLNRLNKIGLPHPIRANQDVQICQLYLLTFRAK